MDPTQSPVACALFQQWRVARGERVESAQRPFTRDWEDLLEKAGIVSATDRRDADVEARALDAEGWLKINTVKYRPYLIGRLAIPLDRESRWRDVFGFVPISKKDAQRMRDFAWCDRLSFVRDGRLQIPFDDLVRLNDFLISDSPKSQVVPIKERSLQIFGDEKRLDALTSSSLFRDDRLDLKDDFACELVGEPLAWKRGPVGSVQRPIIVIENAATWHTYSRWNAETGAFSGVVYGCGNRFIDGVQYLLDIFEELGGSKEVLYFGDIDPQGLRIPQEASDRAEGYALPSVVPDVRSYEWLFSVAAATEQNWEGTLPSRACCEWLGDFAETAWNLFCNNRRIAQEHVSWEFLCTL